MGRGAGTAGPVLEGLDGTLGALGDGWGFSGTARGPGSSCCTFACRWLPSPVVPTLPSPVRDRRPQQAVCPGMRVLDPQSCL